MVRGWRVWAALCLGLGLLGSGARADELPLQLSQIQPNYYRALGQALIVETRACYETGDGQSAWLDANTFTGVGSLRFASGGQCEVVNTYYGASLDVGSYQLQIQGSESVYRTLDAGWLFHSPFCGPSEYSNATLTLNGNAVDGLADGVLAMGPSAWANRPNRACMVNGVFRSARALALSPPGPQLLPDLYALVFNSSGTVAAGGSLNLRIWIGNGSKVAPAPATRFKVYLSKDRVLSSDDLEVADKPTAPLRPGEEYSHGLERLPDSVPPGTYYVIVVLNSDRSVAESNLDNNIIADSRPLNVTPFFGIGVSFEKIGAGSGDIVATNGRFICPAAQRQCKSPFTAEADATELIARPSQGSVFLGWSGACTGVGPCKLWLDAGLALTAQFAPAASVQQVSWISRAPGYLSRVAMVNTSAREQYYSFSVLSENGASIALQQERAHGRIAPRSQLVVEIDQLIAGSSSAERATLVLSSTAPGTQLTAMYNLVQPSTGSISNLAFQRLSERGSPSSSLTLPWMTLDPAYRTELVLSNYQASAVRARLSLLAKAGSGSSLQRSEVLVPANGQLVLPAEQLASWGRESAGALSLEPEAGPSQLRGSYVMVNRATGATNATELNPPSTSPAGSTTLVVPWFSVVDGYDSRFVLVNRSDAAAPYRIELLGETGNRLGAGSLSGTIPARGQIELPARSVLTSTSGGLTRAAAVFSVDAAAASIEGSYQIRSLATGALSQTTMAKPSLRQVRSSTLVLPWFSRVNGYLSRFVLVNRSNAPAPFTVEVLPEDGNRVSGVSPLKLVDAVVPARGMLVLPAEAIVAAFDKLPRAAAVLRVQAADDQVEALYNIVNPATGSISNTLLAHAEELEDAAPTVPFTAQTAYFTDTLNNQSVGFVNASDPLGRPLQFSLAQSPALGTVQIDPQSGQFRYTPAPGVGLRSDRFQVAVFNGVATRMVAIEVRPGSDPLFEYQWSLRNTGQAVFATNPPVAGFDLNVSGAWAQGYSGQGVNVALVGMRVDALHPDLSPNLDRVGPEDARARVAPDFYMKSFQAGTRAAGVIAAAGFNGQGGRGVAFNARLRAYSNSFYGESRESLSNWLGDRVQGRESQVFLFNGLVRDSPPSASSDYVAEFAKLRELRGGRGAVTISGGARGYLWDETLCTAAIQFGVGCMPTLSALPGSLNPPILVGALRADGRRSSYSSTGPALWVAAPAGEYGREQAIAPGLGSLSYDPAILSTDVPGCEKHVESPRSRMDNPAGSSWAPNCEYTASFRYSEAAAPHVAGVVALMLEARPELTERDVKAVLARTARRVDPEHGPLNVSNALASGSLMLEQGWVRNAAGFWFDTWYGFGAVDATAAVNLAKTTALLPPAVLTRSYERFAPLDGTVPRRQAGGLSLEFDVNEAVRTVEAVTLSLNLASTPALGCNQFELVSPSGTRSILLHAATGLTETTLSDARLVSNAFYGEALNGRWTLRVLDVCPAGDPTRLSSTQAQRLSFIAH